MSNINFSALRRGSAASVQDLQKTIQETNKTQYESDDRVWKITTDKEGNGHAVIRFLPAVHEGEVPFVKVYSHGFKVGAKWFIEQCPTTLGGECPVCKANSELWNSGVEADKKVASARKRKLSYYTNILVVNDPAAPENNGQVKLFRFGQKIFEKILEKSNGNADLGDAPRNPFSFFDGCELRLKVKQVAGFPNYDASDFRDVGDLFGGDETKLMEVAEKITPLKAEYLQDSKFKGYEEIKKNFDKVVGNTPDVPSETRNYNTPKPKAKEDDDWFNETPAKTQESAPKPTESDGDKKDDFDDFFDFAK